MLTLTQFFLAIR